MELPRSKRWCATVPLGVGWWRSMTGPNSPSTEQGEGSNGTALCRAFRRTAWCKKLLNKIRKYYRPHPGATLRGDVNNVTPVQCAKIPRLGARAWNTNIMLGQHKRGSPLTSQDPSPRRRGGNQYLLIAMTTSPSSRRFMPSPTKRHKQWWVSLRPSFLPLQGSERTAKQLGLECPDPCRGDAVPGNKQDMECPSSPGQTAWWNDT
jgi:hypothetical protein